MGYQPFDKSKRPMPSRAISPPAAARRPGEPDWEAVTRPPGPKPYGEIFGPAPVCQWCGRPRGSNPTCDGCGAPSAPVRRT